MNLFIRFQKHYLNRLFIEAIKKEFVRKCTQLLLTYTIPGFLVYPATITLGMIDPCYF